MEVVGFICFIALVIAWFAASNIEGAPEKAEEHAPIMAEASSPA